MKAPALFAVSATLFVVGCSSTSAQRKDEPQACTCKVKVASTWCGPEAEQKAKVASLAKHSLCSKSARIVVDLDVAYTVEGC